MRKLWIAIAVFFMAAAFALKANAQDPTGNGKRSQSSWKCS